MIATQNDYNAVLSTLSSALIKLHGGSKSDAAAAVDTCLESLALKICANFAEAARIAGFSSRWTTAQSRPDAENLSMRQVAWCAFKADLKAKILA